MYMVYNPQRVDELSERSCYFFYFKIGRTTDRTIQIDWLFFFYHNFLFFYFTPSIRLPFNVSPNDVIKLLYDARNVFFNLL